ncbi:serine/threonine-protein kinase [Nocardia sp. NBC_01327]|uniref:serine/threonine-protein kinase n=1 Tax=Nocardia sp. NBC_01327 TaxID=2903593 RepID=UPI002E0EF489|nr:serine/threonine protein kinase [Nocardia sp. NBC_01327]
MRGLPPGTSVAGYQIESTLGSGRTAEVYLARHPRLPRRNALKVLGSANGPEFRARFLREAELAARLDHPNIVAVHDCGATGDLLWIAMQFVEGYDAATLIEQHPGGLAPAHAVALITDAAHGLDAAHRSGLLHRDVKPANLLIEAGAGGAERVLVADFGIACVTDESVTLPGAVAGTLAYLSPEQIRGDRADHRADIYALGCTLYQLLTGTVPFPHETAAALMHAHLTAPVPQPSRVNPAVPVGFDNVLRCALAKDPRERYDSCGALAWAAAAALRGDAAPIVVRPRRRRARIALGAVLALALAATTATIVLRSHSENPGARAAVTQPSSSTAAVSAWGAYGFIVDAFRELLPATPDSRGYQGLSCAPMDENATVAPLDHVGSSAHLLCMGDGHPVSELTVDCSGDRTAIAASDRIPPGAVDGTAAWSRPSGSGSISWSTANPAAARDKGGELTVFFDGPSRNFCGLAISSTNSGRDLYDQWWPTAPI